MTSVKPSACRDGAQDLRHCQERLQNLLELSSDWYWEQDEQHRFVAIIGSVAAASANSYGKTRWDPYFASEPVDCTWDQHRLQLDQRQPFYDLILRIIFADGDINYYSISGKPRFDEAGTFRGYCGVSKNITDRKRAEERIQYLA